MSDSNMRTPSCRILSLRISWKIKTTVRIYVSIFTNWLIKTMQSQALTWSTAQMAVILLPRKTLLPTAWAKQTWMACMPILEMFWLRMALFQPLVSITAMPMITTLPKVNLCGSKYSIRTVEVLESSFK